MQCKTCKDNGFVFYVKVIENIKYQFIAYCNCQNSLKWRYNGENCKENKTNYYVENMAQVVAIEEEKRKLTKDDVQLFRRFLPANSAIIRKLEENLKIPDWVLED